jgi:hypothetical protein
MEPLTEMSSPEPSKPSLLRTVFRVLTLRSDGAAVLSGNAWLIVVLSTLAVALWIAFDWLRGAPDPEFYPYDAPSLAWFVLAALLMALAMATRARPAIAFQRVCALLAIIIPVLIAADFAFETYVPERWLDLARFLLALYVIAYFERALKSMTGSRQPVALAAGILVALVALWLTSALYVTPSFWIERGSLDDAAGEVWDESEAILFEQPARIDTAMSTIVRPPSAAPVGFFVGFAGYGEQRVFAEEIKFASQVFGQRYGTSARSVLLINDQRALDAQPLASISSLRYALKAVASKMQLDKDVLFLVLSSHGVEDPVLTVSNGSIPLRDLTGKSLAEVLRDSGIKWRVIVISACHAGAFIESLQDPQTIVLTAAAPDRTSFGCSDDRDLTYFGEAFFRDSLPKSASLRDAFDAAKALIVAREKEEGMRASKPQAFFGESMERQLSEMDSAANLSE